MSSSDEESSPDQDHHHDFNIVLTHLFTYISETDVPFLKEEEEEEDEGEVVTGEKDQAMQFELNEDKQYKVNYPTYNLLSRWRHRLQAENFITYLDLDSALPGDANAKALYVRLVCSLSKLRVLSLRSNRLTSQELTHHIGCLSHLNELRLGYNRLTSLPFGLKFCRRLCVLELKGNQFSALPFFLLSLPHLHTVRRLGNNFNDSYINLRAAMESRLRPIHFRPFHRVPTLCQLAESKVLSTGVLFGDPRPRLADYLLEKVCGQSPVPTRGYSSFPCDSCQKTPLHSCYSLIIFPESFVGISMPPVTAIVCDLPCARKVNEYSVESGVVPPAALNVIMPGRRQRRHCHRANGHCCHRCQIL